MTAIIFLLLPFGAACLSACMPRRWQRVIEYGAIATQAAELFAGFIIVGYVARFGALHFGFIEIDALGGLAIFFSTLVGFAAAIHSVGHLREEVKKGIIGFSRVRQYFVLFHLFFFALFTAVATASPLITWVAIEATTLATALLITFYNKPSALEAGWKHLIINSVGLLLGFLGTLLFLNAAAHAGATDMFISWNDLRMLGSVLDPTLITVAFVFVLVGFGTKVGLVPMHTWLPDAHSKAPIPISSLLSGVQLNIALIAILKFRAITDIVLGSDFSQHLFIFFGMMSLLVAAFIILMQKNYKRMLAYSSIEHMGIITMGIGVGGLAAAAALFHMVYHALLKPILFLSAGNIFLKYSSTKIADVRGALSTLPISALIFFTALFAVAGMPPSGIFFTKLSILSETVKHFPVIALLAVCALTLVFAGFLRHAVSMVFSPVPADIEKGEHNSFTLFSIIFLSCTFMLISFFVPPPVAALIDKAVGMF